MPYRDDSGRPPFDVEAAAKRISDPDPNHDAFTKHVKKQKEFDNLGINTRADYARHIVETIRSPDTKCFHANSDRTVFYRESNNTFVSYDPNRPHGGTCYRPDGGLPAGLKQFDDAFDLDVARNGSPDRARILAGGYDALYPPQTQESTAEYFAKSVEDSKAYPPKNAEMADLVHKRQLTERLERVFAKREGRAVDNSEEAQKAQMEKRAEFYLNQQQSQQQQKV